MGQPDRGVPPGQPASDLLAAYEGAGEPLPPMPVAHGLGLGFDPPVVSPDLRATAAAEILEPGMVLAVTGYVWEQGVGAVFRRDAVLITADGAEVLTSSPCRRYGERRNQAERPTHVAAAERPSAGGDHPLREGPEDQDRDDHVQPSRVPERADVGGAAAVRRPAARGHRRQRRQGGGHPRRRRQPRQRRGPARVHGGQRQSRRCACAELRLEDDGVGEVSYPPKGTFRNGATISAWYANVAGRQPAAAGASRRSASSRPRATATAGTSTSAPTPIW